VGIGGLGGDGLWTQVASFGPFFATTDSAEIRSDDDGFGPYDWVCMAGIINDPSILEQRITATREALAQTARLDLTGVEWRVAASIAHLGLVARFVAPLMGVAVVYDTVAQVRLADAWWRPVLGGPYPLSFSIAPLTVAEVGQSQNVQQTARDFAAEILAGPVGELTETMAEIGSVAEGLLWGNVASGLGGAANMIASVQHALAPNAVRFVDSILGIEPMLGSATYRSGRLWRRSCCLMYRLPGAGYCGDCALSPDAPKIIG
jgi:hypothetical protein